MSDISWDRTCKRCGHDNPDSANQCNSCGTYMVESGMFSNTINYNRRWACPESSHMNMESNDKCICGFSKGGCFIATAVYGSYDAPEVLVLRAFRDKSLMSNPLGRMLTTIYYAISPSLAKIVKRNKNLQRISHYWLDKIVKKLNS